MYFVDQNLIKKKKKKIYRKNICLYTRTRKKIQEKQWLIVLKHYTFNRLFKLIIHFEREKKNFKQTNE